MRHPSMITTLFLATVGISTAASIPSRGDGVRCATPAPTAAQILDDQALMESLFGDESSGAVGADIAIAWHVVHRTNGIGDVSDEMIQDQLDVLNGAYAPSGYSFYTASLDRTANDAWFEDFLAYEESIYLSLAIDPSHHLNLYISDIPYGGFAYFPGTFSESDAFNAVVINLTTLPGGGVYGYDEGDIAAHEVGHYLGLFHTFEGGCGEGDQVADTPAEVGPAIGCPEGRDSCSSPGVDPIHNFMAYTDNFCMEEFTPGQAMRMDRQVAGYRPSLLDGPCGLVVDLTNYPRAVARGSALSFDVAAFNRCEGSQTFDRVALSVTGPATLVQDLYDGLEVEIASGGSRARRLELAVPTRVPEGVYLVKLTLDLDGAEISSDFFPVTVVSNLP